jgi:cell division protein FtsA
MDKNHLLALDIGTTNIKALIAKPTKPLEIIGVGKSHHDGNQDLENIIKSCEQALSKAEDQAQLTAGKAIISITGEVVKSSVTTIKYLRKDPSAPISASEMSIIIEKAQQKAETKAKSSLITETNDKNIEIRLVNSAITTLNIDNHKVTDPIGLKGREVFVQLYTAFAPLLYISTLEKLAAQLGLDLLAIAVESFATTRALLGDDPDSDLTAIVIDIGASTTDIAVVEDGSVAGTTTNSIAGHSFTHKISTTLGVTEQDAEKLKIFQEDSRLKPSLKQKLTTAIENIVPIWLSALELSLEEFTYPKILPNQILLTGGSANLPQLQESLALDDWYKSLSFSRRPTINLIDPEDVPSVKNTTDTALDYSFITAIGLLRVGIDTTNAAPTDTGLKAKFARLLRS